MSSTEAIDSFQAWALRAAGIRGTTKRLEKSAILAPYLTELDEHTLAIAARFFSGVVFPRHDARTTQVGGSILVAAVAAVSGASDEVISERYTHHGDFGDVTLDVLAGREPSALTLVEMESFFASLAGAQGSNTRRALVTEMFAKVGALEGAYLVKLLGGELRIGLKEAQVEEAIAIAFGAPLNGVRRANLLRGDVGEVAQYAKRGMLDSAQLALFHPIGFMLAQPLATPADIVAALPAPFAVEDKYDGIRAQAHVGIDENGAPRVALFSRTLDDITRGYPDVAAALAFLPAGLVLDGELLAYDSTQPERALPFKSLQSRLGRKSPSAALQAEVPATFVAYDVIAAESALVVDESYTDRRARLERIAWPGLAARLAPMRLVSGEAEVESAFVAARARGNEGIIAKDPASVYAPGRRGKTWIKLKRPLATLDVVVTGVERGHGKRRSVLSDYTFAVRVSESDDTLLNVGKAYNGLTDVEIAELTERFKAITVEQFGRFHKVKPEVVLEVTFDIVQASKRHKAGYALRFPRIVRVRDDKPVAEIDTLARVRELAGEASA
ncbi:MAG: ATP-dependent DNA ligase [Gemmatimonadota bacterium]|nr:ATP-dependent DNA ligase [Gemmatimonadota bacterium]